MGSYLEQIRRMKTARKLDEQVLADELNRQPAYRAWVNDEVSAAENRRLGDVRFVCHTVEFGVEMQVSRRYSKFSYSADKVGKFEGELVCLGCLDRDEPRGGREGAKMVFVILDREELEDALEKMLPGIYLSENEGRPYYTIYPTNLSSCPSAVFGDSIAGAVEELVKQDRLLK